MSTKKTPEQRAAERYDREASYIELHRGEGYATAIREVAEPLEAWKESAIKVLSEWDKVHSALGSPGKLGSSMAASSLDAIASKDELIRELVEAGEELRSNYMNLQAYAIANVKDAALQNLIDGYAPKHHTEFWDTTKAKAHLHLNGDEQRTIHQDTCL